MTRLLQLAILADGAGGRTFVLTDGQGLALQARAGAGPAQLPAAVQAALAAGAGGGLLRLVLDPVLADLPWEAAVPGPQAPHRRWATSRQLLAADAPGALPAARPDDARQLTVLACDLVDSTGLMHRLGDEEYSERLLRYHHRVAAIAQRYSGRADDPQGDDGFMCYFGYPVAQEDAAAQALRAGLALSTAVDDLGLQLRIGISTGPVVIRDGQPVGAVIHHAARLQAAAGAGGVLVGAATRRMAGERFDFCPVVLAAPLKGFDASGAVFRVQRERPTAGTERFDARHDLTTFVGRGAQLQTLFDHWHTVAGGQRQAVLLRGEAGIGKSRLVREFRQALAAQGHRTLECRCAPEHSGSAFQPLIDLMRRRLQVHEGDEPSVQLQRLRALQVTSGPQADDALALLGSLLSLPAEVLPPLPAAHAPEQRRRLTMALLERVALGLADQAPVCLILEDVHWMDPSTQALMQRLIDGPPGQRVMLLLTQRASPGDEPAFALPQLALAGLDAASTRELLQGASNGTLHDEALLGWLAERADGVPLFIEESARLAAALAQRHPAEAVAHSLRQRVPGSLRDLLAARLDQCAQARPAAQVGAALGRHFSRGLIEAVCAHPGWPLPGAALDVQLQALVQAGLLTVQAEGGQPVYAFHHALLRDAAHQSLLARDRRHLHGVIASVLQAAFAPLCQAQPELLAWHHEQAGDQAAALAAWEQAARRATARSAHHEAQGHLHRALALLADGPAADGGPAPAPVATPALRQATELRLQLLLAGRLMATAGYGAAPLAAVYRRIEALAAALGDAGALHRARLGLEGFHFMRADFAGASALADALVAGLGPVPEPMAWLQAHWARANLLFHTGQVPQALALADHCLAHWGSTAAVSASAAAGGGLLQHPAVSCHSYAAWALWALGQTDAALARARQAVALAEQLNHPFSLGQALGFLAVAHHFRDETEAGLQAAGRAITVCEAGGFVVWLAHARMLRGRLLASQGDVHQGLQQLTQGMAEWRATGAVVSLPFYQGLQAECLALAGRAGDALAVVDQALAAVARHGERHCAPDLQRLRGSLLWQGGADADGALAAWSSGLDEARAMQAPGLALRCALPMARHWHRQGAAARAADLLGRYLPPVLAGGASPDTRSAAALLAGNTPG